jgi:hypothetical protein
VTFEKLSGWVLREALAAVLRVVEQEQQQQKPSVTDRVKAYLGRQVLLLQR